MVEKGAVIYGLNRKGKEIKETFSSKQWCSLKQRVGALGKTKGKASHKPATHRQIQAAFSTKRMDKAQYATMLKILPTDLLCEE